MCCRYFIDAIAPEMQPIVEAMNRSPLLGQFPPKALAVSRGEVRPANIAPVIAFSRSGRRTVFPMQWGFRAKTLLINARTETAAEKPAFREAWARHRCIIPASWYFEWEHLPAADGKQRTGERYALRPSGGTGVWLCGLYRMEEGVPRFVVLTREPGDSVRFLHDRMPLMLPAGSIDAWIHPDASPEKLLPSALTDIQSWRPEAEQISMV